MYRGRQKIINLLIISMHISILIQQLEKLSYWLLLSYLLPNLHIIMKFINMVLLRCCPHILLRFFGSSFFIILHLDSVFWGYTQSVLVCIIILYCLTNTSSEGKTCCCYAFGLLHLELTIPSYQVCVSHYYANPLKIFIIDI